MSMHDRVYKTSRHGLPHGLQQVSLSSPRQPTTDKLRDEYDVERLSSRGSPVCHGHNVITPPDSDDCASINPNVYSHHVKERLPSVPIQSPMSVVSRSSSLFNVSDYETKYARRERMEYDTQFERREKLDYETKHERRDRMDFEHRQYATPRIYEHRETRNTPTSLSLNHERLRVKDYSSTPLAKERKFHGSSIPQTSHLASASRYTSSPYAVNTSASSNRVREISSRLHARRMSIVNDINDKATDTVMYNEKNPKDNVHTRIVSHASGPFVTERERVSSVDVLGIKRPISNHSESANFISSTPSISFTRSTNWEEKAQLMNSERIINPERSLNYSDIDLGYTPVAAAARRRKENGKQRKREQEHFESEMTMDNDTRPKPLKADGTLEFGSYYFETKTPTQRDAESRSIETIRLSETLKNVGSLPTPLAQRDDRFQSLEEHLVDAGSHASERKPTPLKHREATSQPRETVGLSQSQSLLETGSMLMSVTQQETNSPLVQSRHLAESFMQKNAFETKAQTYSVERDNNSRSMKSTDSAQSVQDAGSIPVSLAQQDVRSEVFEGRHLAESQMRKHADSRVLEADTLNSSLQGGTSLRSEVFEGRHLAESQMRKHADSRVLEADTSSSSLQGGTGLRSFGAQGSVASSMHEYTGGQDQWFARTHASSQSIKPRASSRSPERKNTDLPLESLAPRDMNSQSLMAKGSPRSLRQRNSNNISGSVAETGLESIEMTLKDEISSQIPCEPPGIFETQQLHSPDVPRKPNEMVEIVNQSALSNILSERVIIADTPSEKLAASKEPLENLATSKTPLENLAISQTPLENLATSKTPLENLAISNTSSKKGTKIRVKNSRRLSCLSWRTFFPVFSILLAIWSIGASECMLEATGVRWNAPRGLQTSFTPDTFDDRTHPVRKCSDYPTSRLMKSLRYQELLFRSECLSLIHLFIPIPEDPFGGKLPPGEFS